MLSLFRSTGWLTLMIGVASATLLHAHSPSLSIVTPRAAQRGTEAEVTFHGDRLGDAREVLFYEPGISVVSLDPADGKNLKAKLKIDPQARLGQHIVRVRTDGGITEARTFSIGQYPIVAEKEPNNEFGEPQKITLNTSVHGVADNEDIDYYILEAKKGQRITAEVEAMRLGSALVDCYVAILDLKRFELSASDDSAFALQDPVAAVIAPEDGSYVIAVRESSYAGNGSSRYALHVGTAPRPLMVYPAGGKAGTEIDVAFLGDVRGKVDRKIKLPDTPQGDYLHYLEQDGQSVPSPNKMRVVPFGNVLEAEPNDKRSEATATEAPLPMAFNGIIEKTGDIDYFKFQAKGGQKYDVVCVARGIRSPLDSVLRIRDAKGESLAANDDSGGPDSRITWTVPGDGEYFVSVQDHLRKGGAQYVYRVEFTPVTSSLTLAIPSYARNSQERNTVSVPRGNRYATLIRVGRANFGGDVLLNAPELPPGVTIDTAPIAGNVNEVPVVFQAAPDAAIGAKLVPFLGRHAENESIQGGFVQSLNLIYGQPNNTVYYGTTVDRMAVAVTEEVPFTIRVIEPKVPIVQNGSMNLKVVAERKEGFKAPIQLRMLWNPPGIGSQNEVTIGEGKTEAVYQLNANGGAAVRDWRIAILARSDAGKGTVWTSSQLATLRVSKPFVAMKIPMAAGEQGKDLGVLCNLEQLLPFDGEATVQLHGIPPKVTIEKNPQTITKDSKELLYGATVAGDAPVGQHKTLFCQIVITQNGEPIVHNVGGGGVLRIDPPPPKPKKEPPPPKKVAKAAPEPEPEKKASPPKPLSRLEKLRLEAKQRAEQQN